MMFGKRSEEHVSKREERSPVSNYADRSNSFAPVSFIRFTKVEVMVTLKDQYKRSGMDESSIILEGLVS